MINKRVRVCFNVSVDDEQRIRDTAKSLGVSPAAVAKSGIDIFLAKGVQHQATSNPVERRVAR